MSVFAANLAERQAVTGRTQQLLLTGEGHFQKRIAIGGDFTHRGCRSARQGAFKVLDVHAARGSRLRLILRFGLFLTSLVGGATLLASEAQADFRVCNATQSLVGVAIGYRASAGWVTEGWWHVEGSTCKTLIEGPLSSRFYYLYAEDAERGGRWEGPINMCVAEREFKIAGVNDCFARGFQRSGFQEYDTGEQSSWMVQLTEDPSGDGPAVTGAPQP